MGCRPSKPAQDRDAIQRSAAIDAQIRKDRSNARKEIKILLLGQVNPVNQHWSSK